MVIGREPGAAGPPGEITDLDQTVTESGRRRTGTVTDDGTHPEARLPTASCPTAPVTPPHPARPPASVTGRLPRVP
ncbi:hypothetical protein GCM10010121_085440 [Streptomyces brasiliensis]|uniref:Uncharacterized protein n=1 Tax=Streptomyces brasiliensis TaxID=1954 RepID=A0A917UJ50_9ACTN|nr:hypothetical protein GCM10010121_085440 [Streptomyces brasiliensis]